VVFFVGDAALGVPTRRSERSERFPRRNLHYVKSAGRPGVRPLRIVIVGWGVMLLWFYIKKQIQLVGKTDQLNLFAGEILCID